MQRFSQSLHFSRYPSFSAFSNPPVKCHACVADRKERNRHNISPIEVKSGKNYTLASLRKFRNKYAEQPDTPYVLHTGDLKEEDGIVYLPLCMALLL
jgi:uncharacterized protein